MPQTEFDVLYDRVLALEAFIEEFLPSLIAESSVRAKLEEQLQALAGQETEQRDGDRHWQASLAENVLTALRTG